MYLIRLDDASEYMHLENWIKMEKILDKYDIKPIVGIIPKNEDRGLIGKYERDQYFWRKALDWQEKGWTIAMHGYTHVYSSEDGGINPVNLRSEFAGHSIIEQRKKISAGLKILMKNNLYPKLFFAPAHTFDLNTLEALKYESNIRIICDTVANDIYSYNGFYFIPQQAGHVRRLPFKVVTFCYHPNFMSSEDFVHLKTFLKKHKNRFGSFDNLDFKNRELGFYDKMLQKSYFFLRKIR